MRKKPFAILAIVALGVAAIWAQGTYGTWLPASYSGDDYYGPTQVYPGQSTRVVGAQAQCLTPGQANGQWVGIYIGPYSPGCPGNGSMVIIDVFWPYRDQGSYVLQSRTEDDIPPPSAGKQGWWLAYNYCGNYTTRWTPIHGPYCTYGCDGSLYQCGNHY